MVVAGAPPLTIEALTERPDVCVLAVDADDTARGVVRRLDRHGVISEVVAPERMLAAIRRSDLVVVEAEACSTACVVTPSGGGLAAIAAAAVDVPVWLVAGRARRLPAAFVDAIGRGLSAEHEMFATGCVAMVAGPDGVVPASPMPVGAGVSGGPRTAHRLTFIAFPGHAGLTARADLGVLSSGFRDRRRPDPMVRPRTTR